MSEFEEQAKYKKKKPSNVSKAKKKADHKHEYEPVLVKVWMHWRPGHYYCVQREYCTICGKLNERYSLQWGRTNEDKEAEAKENGWPIIEENA